jgi:outer membrane immunogenic protein
MQLRTRTIHSTGPAQGLVLRGAPRIGWSTKMKKLIMILASGSALAAAPAMAQGAPNEGSTFTGPRVEVITGYDINRAGSSIDNGVDDRNQSTKGVLYGIGAGYDVDLGPVVVGAEAELSDSTAKTKFGNGDFAGFGLGHVKANRDIYVGARVGAKVSPNALIYAKGGYTNAKFDVLNNDGTTSYTQDIDADGWRAGAGVEYAVNKNTYAKLEYRYSNYSKAEVDLNGTLPDSQRFSVDTDRHQIVAGVGVRF